MLDASDTAFGFFVGARIATPEEVFRLYRLWQCSLDDPPPARELGGRGLLDEDPGADEAFARAMTQATDLAVPPTSKPKK